MADFFIDSEGTFYQELSSTQVVREDGLMLFKFTPSAPVAPVTGNPIGLLLSLTYTV